MKKIYTNEELLKLPFRNSELGLEERVEDLLKRLTLKEKFRLSSGRKVWQTRRITRLGIKPYTMYDGPHGVRPDRNGEIKSTYFPIAICRASTWDPELSYEFGKAIGEEVREVGAHMLLAPGINIQRTPMNGRTFEYQTEDPFLNKELAVATVKGIQSQRIAACIKHFICNNQETNRFTSSSEVSERALQEIYYPGFKAAVEEADAWSVMSCYNKLNGIYGSEHKHLLKEVLMNEWGFRGFVVTDWAATRNMTITENCVNAGLTLEMPKAKLYTSACLTKALEEKKFSLEDIDDNVRRLLRVMFLVGLFDDKSQLPKGSRNTREHQELARIIAEEGIVLLKNEGDLLPLDINEINTLAVIGPNANFRLIAPDVKRGGSSHNFPPYEISPIEGLKQKCKNKVKIIEDPSEADIAILFVGLTHDKMDTEGGDRKEFGMSSEHVELINKSIQKNPNTIVVLINGSPVAMDDWIDQVPSVVEAWYGGMEAGTALANVLFGDVNPSGKLTITFPRKLSDSPAHSSEKTYPGDEKVYYDEGIFVGYRHFDTKNIKPQFPFGYGLSYTTFDYKNLNIGKESMRNDDTIKVSADVTNTGERTGKEVIQLYVSDVESSIERPLKELKGFKKIELKPGQTETVTFDIGKDDLSFFDPNSNRWVVESGKFKIYIGSSSKDIRLEGEFEYIK